jgi:DNA-binding CsgD family transcriptional regulator
VLRDFVEFMLGQYTDEDLTRFARLESERAFDPRIHPWLTLLHASAAAYAHARSGDAAEARRYLGWIVPALGALSPTTINQGASVFFTAGAAWELGEAEHAAELRRLALALIASEVADYTPVSSELTVARMSTLLGHVGEARLYFDRARAVLNERGTRPLRAIVDHDEALVVGRQNAAAATELAESARAVFEELEMKGWLDRAETLLSSLRSVEVSGLTPRETEVLRLLAGGRTNKEIAAELVISVHTVERHVATIYRKIGARNRMDATAFAHTSGLANT